MVTTGERFVCKQPISWRLGTVFLKLQMATGKDRMIDWLVLPPEIWAHIFTLLTVEDILQLSLTCHTIHDLLKMERLWQYRCNQAVGTRIQIPECSFHTLYSKMLHRYKYLLGNWQPLMGPYGGYVHVKYENNEIKATSWKCPKLDKIKDSLISQSLFKICLNEKTEAVCLCLGGYQEIHECTIQQIGDKFVFKCLSEGSHIHPSGPEAEFWEWWDGEESFDAEIFLAQEKLKAIKKSECEFTAQKLNLQTVYPKAVIPPGIFKGTYSAHGLELIALAYEDNKALLTKITGDPNIPAGQISVQADLTRPMVLTREQQSSLDTLRSIDIADLPPDTELSQLQLQPFCVPSMCSSDATFDYTQCKFRFHSEGQIARGGYRNPEFTAGHWIVFDENTFAQLWLKLHTISMYCRITEDIT